MKREEFEELVFDTYGVRADYPFEEDFTTGVFRHAERGKWFAIAMNIPGTRLGGGTIGRSDALGNNIGTVEGCCRRVDVVNLKCAPEVIETLVGTEPGIYPAYHMNKLHWLTAELSECSEETLSWLLEASHELTRPKLKMRAKRKQ